MNRAFAARSRRHYALSLRRSMYEPGIWIGRLAPIPPSMIVADQNVIPPADIPVAAIERACAPKKLITISGSHYVVYRNKQETAIRAALAWFDKHL